MWTTEDMIELRLALDIKELEQDKEDFRHGHLLTNMWAMKGQKVSGEAMTLDWKKLAGRHELKRDDESNKIAFGFYSAKAAYEKEKNRRGIIPPARKPQYRLKKR